MKKQLIFFCLVLCMLMPLASAEDITFSVDQKEYYFLTGQQAVIPLMMNNTYDEDINGTITYTVTQEVNQGGFMYSSTNSQSQSFVVPTGNQTIGINFGSSNEPLTLRVNLIFSYSKDGDREVSLTDISIYFVSNQSQMNNQQDPQQSSSEKITNAPPSETEQQPQTPLEKLQNNQMTQDSSALKQQIQQQLESQQEQQEAFEQTLFNNSDFQAYHQEMLDQGYQLSDKQLRSESNDTGSFNLTYQNKQGEPATLQGTMQDGDIQDVQKQTAEDRDEMMDILQQSEQFQKYDKELQQEGFNQTDVSFHQEGNTTTIDIAYEDEQNHTAMISAEFYDKKLQDVVLSKQEELHPLLLIVPIVISVFLISVYLYLRYRKRHLPLVTTAANVPEIPFDHKAEAKRLLLEAEQLYQQKRYKDAYGKAGQSLRLYLSYEHGIRKELTNDEVIRFLRTKKHPYTEIKQCFDVCSLVEFAKYTANDDDFSSIRSTVGTIITGQHMHI
ncbi:MAG: hypothetical protein V1769_01630 [Thermoplasmatota archaeon]